MSKRHIYRSAETGKIVSEHYAQLNPATTERELYQPSNNDAIKDGVSLVQSAIESCDQLADEIEFNDDRELLVNDVNEIKRILIKTITIIQDA